jgi:cobalt-zinc-cadmium efflux system protein
VTEHNHHTALSVESKLRLGLALSISILIAEVVGGLVSNSLALLSDAGHVFTDVIALSLSWYGVRQARRPSSSRMTFGYHRVGVVIAIVNAITIFAIAGVILYEAYRRFGQPPEVKGILMLSIAVVGLGANLLVASWLRREQQSNLNVRSVFWHALGDALASIGVIIGGIVILLTRWFLVDPIISIVISCIIGISAYRILKEGFMVILEATPQGVDIMKLVDSLNQVPGVKDVHDVHVWSISPELYAMSCHVFIDDLSTSQAAGIRDKIEDVVRRFHVKHTTLQMECQQCSSNDIFCKLTSESSDKENKGHTE